MERSHIALHMKKPKPKKLSTWFERNGLHGLQLHRFTESHFEKHVKLIGSLLLAWNDLHEHLASVFAAVMGKPHWARSFAIWHATRNDGGKRRLLRTALANLQGELELDVAARAHAIREISWILDAVDKLEGFRDDSAHTPLTYRFVGNSILDFGDILTVRNLLELQQQIVVPQAGFSNPMALRLSKSQRDLLVEYRYARDRILILRDYVVAVECVWWNPPLPWARRPSLPERRPDRPSKAKAQHRKKK
jgi:hypothetical protein